MLENIIKHSYFTVILSIFAFIFSSKEIKLNNAAALKQYFEQKA